MKYTERYFKSFDQIMYFMEWLVATCSNLTIQMDGKESVKK
jgi:hypothetical protein